MVFCLKHIVNLKQMLINIIKNKEIILASNSPRRKQFFEKLEIPFTVQPSDAEEHFPSHLRKEEIALYIARAKADLFKDILPHQIIITCDTIVWNESKALGKPENFDEAFRMIQSLSGKTHEVVSAVCIKSRDKEKLFYDTTQVTFRKLTEEEITHYINRYKPYDKAGAYGIQEWIGLIGITNIEGSYTNVVGLPTEKLYQELLLFIS